MKARLNHLVSVFARPATVLLFPPRSRFRRLRNLTSLGLPSSISRFPTGAPVLRRTASVNVYSILIACLLAMGLLGICPTDANGQESPTPSPLPTPSSNPAALKRYSIFRSMPLRGTSFNTGSQFRFDLAGVARRDRRRAGHPAGGYQSGRPFLDGRAASCILDRTDDPMGYKQFRCQQFGRSEWRSPTKPGCFATCPGRGVQGARKKPSSLRIYPFGHR